MDPITDFALSAATKAAAQELEAKRGALAEIFAKHTEADGGLALPDDMIVEVNKRNDELTELGKKHETLRGADRIAAENARHLKELKTGNRTVPQAPARFGDDEARDAASKSMGQMFLESKAFKGVSGVKGPSAEVDFNLGDIVGRKALMTTSGAPAGYPPQVLRSGTVIMSAQAQPSLIDFIPVTETTQNSYKYMLETVFTNSAAETAEGSLYPESALTYAEQLANIRKISTFLPITDEQLADEPDLRAIIDDRLTLMVKQRLNAQIVNGNGTAPNLAGLLNTAGIQTQAKGADTGPDAIYKAMVKLLTVAFVDPSGVWFNPVDWQNIRLTKTSFGSYLWGSPDQAGPERIWGLPIAQHVTIPAGTSIVGDFAGFTRLVYRAGLEFEVSNSHADFFQRGQLAIRCQLRAGFVVYRPAAISTVTGL